MEISDQAATSRSRPAICTSPCRKTWACESGSAERIVAEDIAGVMASAPARGQGSSSRSTSPPKRTICWQAPDFTRLAAKLATAPALEPIRSRSSQPSPPLEFNTRSMRPVASSIVSTPKARQTRDSLARRFVSNGKSCPLTLRNRIAGPFWRATRRVISATSRQGSTSASTGANSPARPSSSRKSANVRCGMV